MRKIKHDVILARKKWLDRWIEMRNFEIRFLNEQFLAIYYSTVRAICSETVAIELVLRMNENLGHPFDDDALKRKFKNPNKKKAYMYSNETIIKKLRITDGEVAELGIYKNQIAKAERKKRKEERKELKEEILRDFEGGMDKAEIYSKYCMGGFPSEDTVYEWLKPAIEEKKINKYKQILALYDSGVPKKQIAKRCACSINTVKKVTNNPDIVLSKGDQKKGNCTILESNLNLKVTRYTSGEIETLEVLFSLHKKELLLSKETDFSTALSRLKGSQNNIYLYGGAGTAKTTLLNEYLDSLSPKDRKQTLVVAPTGCAAELFPNGKTIHSSFKLKPEFLIHPIFDGSYEIPKELKNVKRIIIDEISMVRLDVFENVIHIIKHIEEKEHRKIQIIVAGDFCQLEPVVSDLDKELFGLFYPNANGYYAFNSELWEQINFEKIKLTYNYRSQVDMGFQEQLLKLKYANDIENTIQWFNENASKVPMENAITICALNKDVNKINKKHLEKFPKEELKTYVARGDFKSSENLPCAKEIVLAVGIRVMTIYNTRDYKNGNLGTVVKLNPCTVEVKLDNGSTVKIKRKKFILESGEVFEQLPLVLGYAITVNKSQGKTFDCINVKGKFFAAGALYVALSRCKSVSGIHLLQKITPQELIVNVAALKMTE